MAALRSRFIYYIFAMIALVAGIYLGNVAGRQGSWLGGAIALACLASGTFLALHLPRKASELEERYRKTIDKLDAIIDASPLAILSLDASGNITWWSAAAERIFGWSAEEVLGGQNPGIPEEQRPGLHDLKQRTLLGELSGGFQAIRQRKDGSKFYAQISSAPLHDSQGQAVGIVGIVTDISEQKVAEVSLKRSEERFRRLTENATDIIFTFRNDPAWRLDYVSPAVKTVLGYEPSELTGQPRLVKLLTDTDPAKFFSGLGAPRESQFTWSTQVRHKSGETVWLETKACTVVDGRGRLTAVEGIARDVTEHMRLEEQLRYLSLRDELTGLHNRRHFERELQRAVDEGKYPVCVISSDVDGLKLVNDTMGHTQGDDMLVQYANILVSALDQPGVIARIGGDEFALLMTAMAPETASAMIERIEDAVRRYNSQDPSVPLSVSLGMAVALGPGMTLDELLAQADKSMYREKVHRSSTAAHSIVKSLLAALATKDHVGDGHVSRVASLSQALGASARLTKKEMADLALLAEVHDLGKVSTPDRILFKKGPLTKSEREEMEQHSTVGYKIARSSPELSHIAELILHHHECWNGTGYPLGLSGEAIPVQSRILAIVDAYDVMTNDQPYRNAMGRSAALQELRRCSGLQFDPVLTDLFIRMLEQGAAAG